MKHYSTEEIIKGIADRRDRIINYVYSTCYDEVRKLILMNNGSDEDVKDIFQEALLLIYQKIILNNFNLKCQFKTYLYSVCRFLWLREIVRKRTLDDYNDELPEINPSQFTIETSASAGLKIFNKHFRELSRECKKVLNMYYNNSSMEEICKVMGYKNVHIVREKKYRCKKNLLTKIYNNPDYKRLKDEIYLVS